MLIGGFYSVDGRLLCEDKAETPLLLKFDRVGKYSDTIYTSNGRTASVYCLEHCRESMNGKKVLLPDYLCLSVISAIQAAGIDYEFYRIKRDLTIDIDYLEKKVDGEIGMIYVIHYFSKPQPADIMLRIKGIAENNEILLMEDITQALFNSEENCIGFGDYVVGSVRKWFPMTDGGLAAVRRNMTGSKISLEPAYDEAVYREAMISAVRDYYDNAPEADIKGYLEFEKRANAQRYVNLAPREMTKESLSVLLKSDKEDIVRIRQENYALLYDRLSDIKEIEIMRDKSDCCLHGAPFGMFMLVPDRDDLYRYLTEKRIIPEIQWILPLDCYKPGEDAMFLSSHNLMLQCDQRYGAEEMEYTAEVIKDYFGA